MIKLIASDMDGTLLTTDKKLPEQFGKMLSDLKKKDVCFMVASGRSYTALEPLFRDFKEKPDLICDNGAFLVFGGKVCDISVIKKETVRKVIAECEKIAVAPVLCGVHGTYFAKGHPQEFLDEMKRFYLNFTEVEELRDVEDDIFKVAIYDFRNPKYHAHPILSRIFGKEYNLQVSGDKWMDIMNRNINKGNALKLIKEKMGIDRSETMTFGDFYNDVELLGEAEYSFVMENSDPDMKKYGNYIAESNDNNGVVKAIYKYVINKN